MPGTYARGTEVSVNRSRDEIERTLTRFGATGFTYGWEETASGNYAAIMCKLRGRTLRFLLPLPDRDDFYQTPSGRKRTGERTVTEAYQQAVMERWRALGLIIKAKVVAVESGVVTFEDEFIGAIVLPTGKTISETVLPQLEEAYTQGQIPSILPIPRLPKGRE